MGENARYYHCRLFTMRIAIIAIMLIASPALCSEDEIVPESPESQLAQVEAGYTESPALDLQLVQEDANDSAEGRRRRRKGGFFKKVGKHVSNHAKKAADAAKKLAEKAYKGFMRTAEAGVSSMDRGINSMSKPPKYMSGLINVAKKSGKVTVDITKHIWGVVDSEERAGFIQELASMHDKSATKGRACFEQKIPNIAKTSFVIKKISSPVKIPDKKVRFCEPSWIQKARTFLSSKKRMVSWGKTIMKALGKSVNWIDNTFDARDQMLLGPTCEGVETMGIQFTASLSAGAAKAVGGGITAEVGFQVGCMSKLPKNLHGKQGH